MAGGRKREFCKQQALDAAMQVFWKKGYVGASLSDLTDGMGINKPSMYAAFGNKEDLFVEATNYYLETRAQKHADFLEEEGVDLKTRVRNYLMSVLAGQCDEDMPKGCYISLCVAEAAGEEIPDNARNLITEASGNAITTFAELFEQDAESKDLGLDKVAKEKALFLVSILHGTAAMARAGKSQKELVPVIENAMAGLMVV